MEVDEEPVDSTDPVGDITLIHNPEAELEELPAAGKSVPPCSDGASSPIVVPREDGGDLIEKGWKNSLEREQASEAGDERKPSLVEETLEPREMYATPAVTLPSPKAAHEMADGAEGGSPFVEEIPEPREMDTTPAVTPPSPEAALGTEKKAGMAECPSPAPEGYVTPTGLLSATGSPTRPRSSPKRKQLSSPDGSEIAAGLGKSLRPQINLKHEHHLYKVSS